MTKIQRQLVLDAVYAAHEVCCAASTKCFALSVALEHAGLDNSRALTAYEDADHARRAMWAIAVDLPGIGNDDANDQADGHTEDY